jgi:hypothetical protein
MRRSQIATPPRSWARCVLSSVSPEAETRPPKRQSRCGATAQSVAPDSLGAACSGVLPGVCARTARSGRMSCHWACPPPDSRAPMCAERLAALISVSPTAVGMRSCMASKSTAWVSCEAAAKLMALHQACAASARPDAGRRRAAMLTRTSVGRELRSGGASLGCSCTSMDSSLVCSSSCDMSCGPGWLFSERADRFRHRAASRDSLSRESYPPSNNTKGPSQLHPEVLS